MKKSIIALFALTSSYVYAAETIGTIVSIQPATKIEQQISSSIDSFDVRQVTDLDNNIVTVETPNKNRHTFIIESKYALKIGQSVDVVVDEKIKDNVANVAQTKETLAAK
jgi:uncharacterized protein (DUF2249 family)